MRNIFCIEHPFQKRYRGR